MAKYRVVAPLALVVAKGEVKYVYENGLVPSGADKAVIDRLLAFGIIEAVDEATDEADEDVIGTPPSDNLDNLDRAALQALAKERGIAANQTSEDLIAALRQG